MPPTGKAYSQMHQEQRIRHGASSGIFYGWWIVAIGTVITFFGSLYFYGFTIFFLPLSRELGISRAATSVIFSTARMEGALGGPVIGWLTDRVGPRIMLVTGAALAGLGFLLLSVAHSFWAVLVLYAFVISLGFNMGFFQGMIVAANNWFLRHRTLAISIISASFRLGAAILLPLLALVVLHQGWRTGAAVAGVLILALVLPLSFFIRNSPESMGLLPDGATPVPKEVDPKNTIGQETIPRVVSPKDATVREALKSPVFWFIALANGLRVAVFAGIVVHLVPIFVWRGISEQGGANLVGLMALTGLPITLFLGWLADRWMKPGIMVVGNCSSALGMGLFALVPGVWATFGFVVLFAIGESIGPANWSVIGDMFGRRNFATIRGVITGFGLVGAVTPIYVGWVFDTTQSYTWALMTLAALAGVAAVLYGMVIGPWRRRLAPAY